MITYPVIFEGSAESVSGMNLPWQTVTSSMPSPCSIPKSFEGPGGTHSPEDFFLLALQNCFIATFKVFAEYSRLSYVSLKVDAKLTVDKDESGKPWLPKINLHIRIHGTDNVKKAQLLVSKTLENGFILRSVKTEVIPTVEIL